MEIKQGLIQLKVNKMGTHLRAIEYVLPKNKISNKDLAIKFPNYDFNKFEKKIGIQNRYWLNKDETALDLAIKSCTKLLKRFDKNCIDYIIYCTQSPEYFLPTTACILQNKLGLKTNIGALDFNLGCSGYTYGLSLAKGLINSGQAKNILLVTAESYSKYIHSKDRTNMSIFGDASTASLISYSDEECFGEFNFGTDGSGFDKLIVKNGASKKSFQENAKEFSYGTDNIYTDNNLYMNGPEVFNFTISVVPNSVENILLKNKIKKNEIDQFIFHQANAFMLKFLMNKTKIDPDKFYIDLKDGGNTVSNTIPIALKKYSESIIDNNSKKILLMGFGVGLSWCGGTLKINNKL